MKRIIWMVAASLVAADVVAAPSAGASSPRLQVGALGGYTVSERSAEYTAHFVAHICSMRRRSS